MKKILSFIFILSCFGCKEPNVKSINQEINIDGYYEKISTYEWVYKNHTYIILKSKNNISLTHAGHCRCNKLR
jgi:hypothetical protein